MKLILTEIKILTVVIANWKFGKNLLNYSPRLEIKLKH